MLPPTTLEGASWVWDQPLRRAPWASDRVLWPKKPLASPVFTLPLLSPTPWTHKLIRISRGGPGICESNTFAS